MSTARSPFSHRQRRQREILASMQSMRASAVDSLGVARLLTGLEGIDPIDVDRARVVDVGTRLVRAIERLDALIARRIDRYPYLADEQEKRAS